MATQLNFQWQIPSSANTISQKLQYRRDIDPAWTEGASGISPMVNEYALPGTYEDNRIYVMRVIGVCSKGGDFYSPEQRAIRFVCPVPSFSPEARSLGVQFAHVGGSVDQYIIMLYDATGANVMDSKIVNGSIPAEVSEIFTGLEPNTNYRVKIHLYAGLFSKMDCAAHLTKTTAGGACAVPTITGASIS